MEEQLKLKIKALDNYFCFKYEITVKQLHSKFKKPAYATARFLCWYYLRKHTRLSLSKIGDNYNRDHATVHLGLKRLNGFWETERFLMKNKDQWDQEVKAIFNINYSEVSKGLHLIILQKRSAHYRQGLNR